MFPEGGSGDSSVHHRLTYSSQNAFFSSVYEAEHTRFANSKCYELLEFDTGNTRWKIKPASNKYEQDISRKKKCKFVLFCYIGHINKDIV